MNETESTNRSWIAGLMEHRIALGIALLASILLIVFMFRPSKSKYDKPTNGMHVMIPAHPTIATNQQGNGQKGSEGPTYNIPAKPANQPQASTNPVQTSPAVTAPATQPVTTPSKPASATGPATKPAPIQQTKAAVHKSKAAAHGYFVQTGSFHDLANARKEAARLALKGWNSSVASNTAGLHTVRIGPVPTRTAAEKLRQRLVDKAKLRGFIVKG